MKRAAVTLAALVLAGVGFAPDVAEAGAFTFSGVVTDANGGAPLGGVVITATAPGAPAPDAVVVTEPDGSWTFESDEEELALYLDGGADYQSGYRGCGGYAVPTYGEACTFGPGAWPTVLLATWVSGRILDSATLVGVPGATVEARAPDGVTVLASGLTGTDGSYRLTGLVGDEFALYVNGAAVGYGSGWFGCAASVVPTYGEACTYEPGAQADRLLSALPSAPLMARGFSLRRGEVTLLVRPPAGVVVNGYQLTCKNLRGVVTVRVYPNAWGTQGGFASGRSTCSVRIIGPLGLGTPSRAFVVLVR